MGGCGSGGRTRGPAGDAGVWRLTNKIWLLSEPEAEDGVHVLGLSSIAFF